MYRDMIFRAVHDYVATAASRLRRDGYRQENGYLKAFIGRLDGLITFDDDETSAFIDLKCTNVDDQGRGAAEGRTGADFAIIYEASGLASTETKALLGQGKNYALEDLNRAETIRLGEQCEKMVSFTDHYLVLEPPVQEGGIPDVRIGKADGSIPFDQERISFDRYFVDYLIACFHGDRRGGFINAVHHSNMAKLVVKAEGFDYEPNPGRNRTPRPGGG
ncbi:hypothetical protein HFN45_16110 [Rhizobium leguminosarum]|nr:hypothetical protein [Rhizobium leguminosarum]